MGLLLRSITDNDNFVQLLQVLGHCNTQFFPVFHHHPLRHKTYIRKFQDLFIYRHINREPSFHISNGTDSSAFYLDGNTDQRLSILIKYYSFHRQVLLCNSKNAGGKD